jgi:hypothetical protein
VLFYVKSKGENFMRNRIVVLLFLFSMTFAGFVLNGTSVEGQKTTDKRRKNPLPNKPADVESVSFSKEVVQIPCPNTKDYYRRSDNDECFGDMKVDVTTVATDAENDVLTYTYEVSGGRIIGQGAKVVWDLALNQPGTYTIKVSVDDGCGVCGKTLTRTVEVARDCCCYQIATCPPCPEGSIKSSADIVKAGDTIIFTAENAKTDSESNVYNWTISGGTIVKGQGTPAIEVKTNAEMIGTSVRAAIERDRGDGCPVCRIESESVWVTKE